MAEVSSGEAGLVLGHSLIEAAAKAYAVYYTKLQEVQPGAYLMDHSRTAFLMGPDGEPIALLPVDEGSEGVTEVLRQWVN